MATNFPTSLDSLTNPTSSDSLNSPSHSAQHANANDAIEALQAKVGVDSSAVTSSLDYKVAQLEAASTGKILQVVTATYSTAQTTTSTTLVDTNLTASITPSSATSKVLVMVSFPVRVQTNLNAYQSRRGFHAISRGGTNVFEQITSNYYDQQGTTVREMFASATLVYLDSPATTSATTYTLQHRTETNSTVYTFAEDHDGSITLLEVSA